VNHARERLGRGEARWGEGGGESAEEEKGVGWLTGAGDAAAGNLCSLAR
jgi:hypothetical protein